jgi:ComF family protein
MMAAAPRRLGSTRPHWRYTVRQAAWAAVDLIFPPQCGGCEKVGNRFCPDCLTSLQCLLPPLCEHCGDPLARGEAGRCAACRRKSASALAGTRSVAFFEGSLQHALHRLKYKRDIILADSLARLLQAAWQTLALPGEVVIPVPLSPQRLRERGYNQAGLLARGFAELAGLRYAPEGAGRVRHTASQVGLSAEQRRANVAGAFEGRPRFVAGRAVILVDDVRTTGATLEACAEALRAAGAASIWGLTLARAQPVVAGSGRRVVA